MFKIKCNHQIKISKENEFIAEVQEKEKICIETINAYGAKFKDTDALTRLINEKYGNTHHHPLTGPIYIKNAKPGDVLKIHIHKIETEEMAQSLSRSAGISSMDETELTKRNPILAQKNSEKEIDYGEKIKLTYRPMIGIIATTPKEDIIKTGHANKRNGGNLDIPFITEESDVYIPVDIKGAGLYIGDVHGTQGYGELSGIALEASSKIILEIEILKPKKPQNNIIVIGKEPFSEKECIGIIGIGEKMKLEKAIYDSFQGAYKILEQLISDINENTAKLLTTLIGNSFNGQAFSKTSESTSIVVIKREDINKARKQLYKNFTKEIEQTLFIGG